MPELPDLESARRRIEAHAGEQIVDVRLVDPGLLRNASVASMCAGVRGATLHGADRRGKWLVIRVGDGALVLHLGMTGRLLWSAAGESTRFTRLVLQTAAASLTMDDRRRLGALWWCRDTAEAWSVAPPLGPDALTIDRATLGATLARSRAGLKVTLMDQARLAGLGNTLSDEVLWRAQLHPARAARSLDPGEVGRLDRAIRSTVRAAVRAGEIPRRRSWLAGRRGLDDARCPRCAGPLRTSAIGGRTSWWCPVCQPVEPHPPSG